jgi:polar amino acid transport system substrate-binding protein
VAGRGLTLKPGVLKAASAFADPPFEVEAGSEATGLDVELMRAICRHLGLAYELVKYRGDDFDGIFAGLAGGAYDAVISGTTITPERRQLALFSAPYLAFDQALVVNRARTPAIRSVGDLRGQTVGIQQGNTSDLVARRLRAEGAIAAIQYYPYHGILDALDDLAAGRVGALIKLYPVASWLVRDRPGLAVVQQIPTHEQLGIAVARTNAPLCDAMDRALEALKQRGAFQTLCRKWLP